MHVVVFYVYDVHVSLKSFVAMGKILLKRGNRGIATSYLSRKQSLNKLGLSLKDFRRLCILKGIYPVEPHHKKKANKNNSTNKTYFYVKDIQFLAHEPLIDKFRSFKVFARRLRKAVGKKDQETAKHLRENEPTYNIDHIIKERYPTFTNALRELDDVLSLCFLFSTMPKNKSVKPELIHLCRKLTVEFQHYVIESKALRKVFVSIKGYYYQVEIMGQIITWMVPHPLGYNQPSDVDFKIMLTFVWFYSRVLGFVNYKLFNSINLIYPPKLVLGDIPDKKMLEGEDDTTEFIAALNFKLKSSAVNAIEENEIDDFTENLDDLKEQTLSREELRKFKNLFSGCKIFLNREVPKESLVFIIRCFGGEVSFDKSIHVGATFDETDEDITHQIVDRPNVEINYLNRYYVQPQWIYDCVNAKVLLPVSLYLPGEKLPPHLSPFVEHKEGDYIPPEELALVEFQKGNKEAFKRNMESNENSDEEESAEESSEEKLDDESDSDAEETKTDTAVINKKRKLDVEDSSVVAPKMSVTPGKVHKDNKEKIRQKEAAEEKQLGIMMMHKKDKHLYNKIIFGQKRKKREALKLKEKRDNLEKEKKMKKKYC